MQARFVLKLTNHRSFLNFGKLTIKGAVQLHHNGAAAAWPAEKIGFPFRHYIGTFMPSFYYIFRAYPYGTAKMGFEYHNYWVGRDGPFYCMNESDGGIIWRANLLATG